MIVVKIMGGLGNQMFQYALGRCMSLKNDQKLILDRSPYLRSFRRRYSLKFFQIEASTSYKFGLNFFKENLFYCLEKNFFNFEKSILDNTNCYLDGFWQNENYFIDIKETLKKDFTLKDKYYQKLINKKYLEQIQNQQSVSIHVRRGDCVKNKKVSKIYKSCSLDYFSNAIEKINSYVKNAKFFCFSDDLNWCKNKMKSKNITFIENTKDYEEMVLMSNCKHNIISNSTFSWWAAWLNNYKEKIIICPKKWRYDDLNTKSLIPLDWIKI